MRGQGNSTDSVSWTGERMADRWATDMLLWRVVRCMSVSAGTTFLSAVIIVVLIVGFGVPGGVANVIAVGCGILPSYIGNRYWVWRLRAPNRFVREVAPFWALSGSGLVLSTIAVARVDDATRGWSASLRSVALPLANLSVFAALWVVQFVVLDRFLFRAAPSSPSLLGEDASL